MKVENDRRGFTGEINGISYPIQDDQADWFSEKWKQCPVEELVEKLLQEESLLGADLTDLKGFAGAVTESLQMLVKVGATQKN